MKSASLRRIANSIILASLTLIPALATGQFTVVVNDLQGPRGLAFGPEGQLYVAQAGTGGNTASGKISEILNPSQTQPVIRDIVTGLISANDSEGDILSVAGLSTRGDRTIYAIMELSDIGTGFTGSLLGNLLEVRQDGLLREISNVGNFDYVWSEHHLNLNPGQFPDADPYALLELSDRFYIVDAGTNTLNVVHRDGSVKILVYVPNMVISNATPTCVAQGPDGALYVGTLALDDSLAFGPSAKIYRYDPNQNALTVWTTGLWPINGCAFGPDGTFYASEFITNTNFTGGDVVKIPFDNPNTHTSLTNDGLNFPAGIAVGPDGFVYVSNDVAFEPQGQVVRLENH